jgi:hypothetical protein
MCGQHHIPANLLLKKHPSTHWTEAEWTLQLAWTQEKNLLPPLGIQPWHLLVQPSYYSPHISHSLNPETSKTINKLQNSQNFYVMHIQDVRIIVKIHVVRNKCSSWKYSESKISCTAFECTLLSVYSGMQYLSISQWLPMNITVLRDEVC